MKTNEMTTCRSMKIREYSAVIEGTDMIRVAAASLQDAVRQIASRCEPEETFEIGRSIYKVNGFLAKNPATRLRKPPMAARRMR